eukprot:CAMPEP_0184649360 /NCGR_PEP_ID=MMETSP0308-20130426/6696_1 /TAXON_ID=38269 /ORGANISM="Gloeochaete witrockiana, Strain SAG 46.84" /LENGTH=333 /DNA_ID=CAMNT_0027082005 /DNA_START=1606 /DNA_END=2604 /DNA_ORIENTATION=+
MRHIHSSYRCTYPIYAASWTSNGRVILGGGGGSSRTGIPNALTLCEITEQDGKGEFSPLYTHSTGTGAVTSLCIHPKGNELVCVVGGKLELYAFADDEKKIEALESQTASKDAEQGPQKLVRFSVDGATIATAGEDDHIVHVWDYPQLKLRFSLAGHSSTVYEISFDPAGELVATASADKQCIIWKLSDASQVKALRCPRKPDVAMFRGCSFSADGLYLFTVQSSKGAPSVLTKWQVSDWNEVESTVVNSKPATSFAMSQDGQFVAVGTAEGQVAIVDAARMRTLATITAHDLPGTAMAFASSVPALVSVSADYSCRVIALPDSSSGVSIFLW